MLSKNHSCEDRGSSSTMNTQTIQWFKSALCSAVGNIFAYEDLVEEADQHEHDAHTQVVVTGAVVALVLLSLSLLFMYCLARRPHSDPKAIFFAVFEAQIRGQFPEQTPEAMGTVLTGVNSVLRPHPVSPCVLLFVSPPAARDTALSLARAVAAAVQAALVRWPSDEVEVSGLRYSGPEDYWFLMDSLSLRLSEQRVAILSDIQALHPHAAAALAHLGDDTFAPYPQSVLLLTLAVAPHTSGAADAVAVAERTLTECWQDPGQEVPLQELLGRLTGRALLVQPQRKR